MYELFWDSENGILIQVDRAYVDSLPVLHDGIPLLAMFGIENKEFTFGEQWGYGSIIKRSEDSAKVVFKATLPEYSLQCCYICNGSGLRNQDLFPDEKCLCCNGTGKASKIPSAEINAIRHSLAVLFKWLNYGGLELEVWEPLIEVEMCVGDRSGDLYGKYSRRMMDFIPICVAFEEYLKSISGIMYTAWDRMSKASGYNGSFQRWAYTVNGETLILDVPGSASGIYQGQGLWGEQRDCFYSHNMDTGIQQLTVLAGLAALQDKCRFAGAELGACSA